MTVPRRTDREVARALRLDRANRSVDALRHAGFPRQPPGAAAMNWVRSASVAMISIGKKLWNTSTDWMRVVRPRGSRPRARARTDFAHSALGVSTEAGYVTVGYGPPLLCHGM